MQRLSFLSKLGLFFLALSAAIYSIHYLIFSDASFIFRYLIAQLGFLPINVLLVTLVLNSLISNRAKNERLQKLNIVVGAFFSDVGTDLLRRLARFDVSAESLGKQLIRSSSRSDKDFTSIKSNLKEKQLTIEVDIPNLLDLQQFLNSKRAYLLRLLENPNLLEHEKFTDLLWAVFHLTEELANRKDLTLLPKSDYAHLGRDINRAYIILITQWLDYMQHLQSQYPYLFSLAMRTNPFDPEAKIEVQED